MVCYYFVKCPCEISCQFMQIELFDTVRDVFNADDSSSTEGCDRCFYGFTQATLPSLKYINVDESTTFESFGNQIADQLDACQSGLVGGIIGAVGRVRARPLLSFQSQCDFDFQQYSQTAQLVVDWYSNQGIDLLGILNGNAGSSDGNTN